MRECASGKRKRRRVTVREMPGCTHSRHVRRLLLYLTDCFHLFSKHFLYDCSPPATPPLLHQGNHGSTISGPRARASRRFFDAYPLGIACSLGFYATVEDALMGLRRWRMNRSGDNGGENVRCLRDCWRSFWCIIRRS